MGANCLGCNPRELTAEALRRDSPGVQPPRTCAILLMSTSEASCHWRELRPQALGLQSLPDVWYAKQNPREECLL